MTTTHNTPPSNDDPLIEQRKKDHVEITRFKDVQSELTTGLERYHYMHRALPDLNLDAVDTAITVFGKRLAAPILISSMTGGILEGTPINRTLAAAAQHAGIAMGLGSQRAAIIRPELAETFRVRDVAPDILRFANVGAVQLNYGFTVDDYRRAVDMAETDALILHFNALQEAVQPEGDRDFSGLLPKLETLCRTIGVPVIAKEVGWGFSKEDIRRLVSVGVNAIDVAGAGGTSWSQVESFREMTEVQQTIARAFVGWGIPTADAIRYVREAAPDMPIFASGGLKDGIDVAKCITLGASLGGFAQRFIKVADQGVDAVIRLIEIVRQQLQITMFMTASADIAALRKAEMS